MNCIIHQNSASVDICNICHKPYCEECLVNVDGVNYCKEHVAQIIENNRRYRPEGVRHEHYGPHNTYNNYYGHYYPYKNRVIALLLAIFLGIAGIHRFYVGKIGTGLLWLFTGGLFGIGWIIDIILIALGSFRDKYGYPLI